MKKGLILTTCMAALLGVGVFAGFSAGKDNVKEASAYSQGSVIANDKARIWIGYYSNNPFYSYADDGDNGIKLWIHSTSTGGSDEHVYSRTGTFSHSVEDNRRYDYFDVNLSDYTNSWYMTVQKFQGGNWKAATNSIQLSSSNAFKVYYVDDQWAWDKTQGSIVPGSIGSGANSVDAGLAAKALGGIHTCSSSNINGYNAFLNFNSTFVKNGETWKTKGNLNDYTLDDYATGDKTYTGSASTTTNAYDKYLYVQEMYSTGGNPTFAPYVEPVVTNNSSTMTIILASFVAVTATGGFVFLKKKKISK